VGDAREAIRAEMESQFSLEAHGGTDMAYLSALVSVMCVQFLLVSDTATDLSGEWRLQKLDTGGTRGVPDIAADTLVIYQTATELRLELRWTDSPERAAVAQVFSFDGRENRNPSDNGKGELKSRCRWDTDTLEIQGTELVSTTIAFKRTFSLSPDRRVLKMVTKRSTSSRAWSHARTFVKSERPAHAPRRP
jgi:hypothetical protein